jgi:hypothetical protein
MVRGKCLSVLAHLLPRLWESLQDVGTVMLTSDEGALSNPFTSMLVTT